MSKMATFGQDIQSRPFQRAYRKSGVPHRVDITHKAAWKVLRRMPPKGDGTYVPPKKEKKM
jgi:hypothetical protein